MFIGQLKVSRNGRSYTYHRLLESVRTDKGPRQRLVLSLGTLDLPKSEWPRLAERIEDLLNHQELIPFGSCDLDQLAAPFAERIRHKQQRRRAQQEGQGPAKEVYPERSGSEHIRELGPEYVAHVFWERLHCDQLLQRCGLSQRQCRLAEIQVVGRLLAPRSERGTVGWFARTALAELMPGSVASVNKDALYRISDQLYAHRVAIETGLAARERELFALQETIILYDLSSTYFEGIAARNEKAEHGYSRDHRPDCKQVVVGLVLDGEGFPKAHEVFTGNTKDETSLARMLDSLDCRTSGAAGWPSRPTVIMDRGLATDENLELLRKRGEHYIVTTPQSERRELFAEIDRARYVPVKVNANGKVVVSGQLRRHQGELYVLCHSVARASKDRAIRQRFEQRLEQDADKLKVRVAAGRLKKPEKINRALGRLLGRYPRVARYYTLQMHTDEKGQAEVTWARKDAAQQLAEELDGTYLLRTDRTDLAEAELWKLYVLLARIEQSFRYLKSHPGDTPGVPSAHRTGGRAHLHLVAGLPSAARHRTASAGERRPSLLADDPGPVGDSSDGDHRAPVHRWDGTAAAAAIAAGVGASQDLPSVADTGYPAAARRETIVVTKENVKSRYRNNLRQKMLNLG